MNPEMLRAKARDLTLWSVGLTDNLDALEAGEAMLTAADAWEAEHLDTNELINAAYFKGYHDGLDVYRKRLEAAEKVCEEAERVREKSAGYLDLQRALVAWRKLAALAAGESET